VLEGEKGLAEGFKVEEDWPATAVPSPVFGGEAGEGGVAIFLYLPLPLGFLFDCFSVGTIGKIYGPET
jgi:hypothetical protein